MSFRWTPDKPYLFDGMEEEEEEKLGHPTPEDNLNINTGGRSFTPCSCKRKLLLTTEGNLIRVMQDEENEEIIKAEKAEKQDHQSAKKIKRAENLLKHKWDEVIEISSIDESSEDDIGDTADSLEMFNENLKLPKIVINSRNRPKSV